MDIGLKIMSDITVYSKYARHIDDKQRRETWEEIVERYCNFMKKKYPMLVDEIEENKKFILEKKVLPSMRALQFAGEALEKNPTRGYNCFRRNTKFITSQGLRSFEDFEDGDVIKVMTHKKRWKTAIVKKYGNQSVNEITFRKGRSEKKIYATGSHRQILKNNESTTNLQKGDGIYSVDWFNDFDYQSSEVDEKLMQAHGYVYGDGTKVKKNGKYVGSLVRLCKKDNDYLDRFLELGFTYSSPISYESDHVVYTGKYLKELPVPGIESPERIRAFMRGYLDADGAKNNCEETSSLFKSVQSSKKEDFEKIRDLLSIAGFFILGEDDYTGQQTNYGVRPETIRFRGFTKYSNSPASNQYARNIEENVNTEEVWCLEVEDDQSFILEGGIVTGNCSFVHVDDYRAFSETMFLLLSGAGVGFSVQSHHVNKLPVIRKPIKTKRYLISDDIQGQADAVKILMKSYFGIVNYRPIFDYSDIRPKGSRLVTSGGKAPGPGPLRICLTKIDAMLSELPDNHQLTPLECHDIMCHLGDAVLAGGIRRAALISLFDFDDEEMLNCKVGNWSDENPQRARSNNSAVIDRNRIKYSEQVNFFEVVKNSGSGEPGVFFTNDIELGTNPCAEISLRSYGFCNLCEKNMTMIHSQEDDEKATKVAAFFGTLQAGLTDFIYLRNEQKETCEKDALLGIGMTGIANQQILDNIDFEKSAQVAINENIRVADIIGIRHAARVTTVKPSGTTSCVLGTSSGIHAQHNDYYFRRMKFNKDEPLFMHLMVYHPELIEEQVRGLSSQAFVKVAVKAPDGAILRTEPAMQTLERVKKIYHEQILPGHVKGRNTHNVSCTINVKDNEQEIVRDQIWANKDWATGISMFPFYGGTHEQMPFEDCSKEQYEELIKTLSDVDLSKIIEDDNTDLTGEMACAGGACEIL